MRRRTRPAAQAAGPAEDVVPTLYSEANRHEANQEAEKGLEFADSEVVEEHEGERVEGRDQHT